MGTPKARQKPAGHAAPSPPSAVVVKGLSATDLDGLDRITRHRAATLAEQGGTTSRNAVIVLLLREAIARELSNLAPVDPSEARP